MTFKDVGVRQKRIITKSLEGPLVGKYLFIRENRHVPIGYYPLISWVLNPLLGQFLLVSRAFYPFLGYCLPTSRDMKKKFWRMILFSWVLSPYFCGIVPFSEVFMAYL